MREKPRKILRAIILLELAFCVFALAISIAFGTNIEKIPEGTFKIEPRSFHVSQGDLDLVQAEEGTDLIIIDYEPYNHLKHLEEVVNVSNAKILYDSPDDFAYIDIRNSEFVPGNPKMRSFHFDGSSIHLPAENSSYN